MRKKKYLLLLISFIFLLSCGKKEPIRIGVNSWPPCEIWYIAQQMKYFGNTDVEIVRFSSWSDNMNSLYLGQTDITHSTYFNAVFHQGKGEKGEIFLISDTIKGGDGLALKNNLKEIKDLKGKRVAVEVNTDEHFLLYKALESVGLEFSDINIVSTTSKKAADLFIENKVDALFTYEPFLTKAAKNGDGKIVFTTKNIPNYMIDVLVGKAKTIEKRKKDYKNIIKAWYKAQKFIKNNPDKAFEIMGKNESLSKEGFEAFYNSFTFFSLKENKQILSSDELREKLDEMRTFLKNNNISDSDTTGVINKTIVNSIKKIQ